MRLLFGILSERLKKNTCCRSIEDANFVKIIRWQRTYISSFVSLRTQVVFSQRQRIAFIDPVEVWEICLCTRRALERVTRVA
jgi:hypothetical protein